MAPTHDSKMISSIRHRTNRRRALQLAGPAGLASLGGAKAGSARESDDSTNGCRLGEETASWTVGTAGQVELNGTNTVPAVSDIDEATLSLRLRDIWPFKPSHELVRFSPATENALDGSNSGVPFPDS